MTVDPSFRCALTGDLTSYGLRGSRARTWVPVEMLTRTQAAPASGRQVTSVRRSVGQRTGDGTRASWLAEELSGIQPGRENAGQIGSWRQEDCGAAYSSSPA